MHPVRSTSRTRSARNRAIGLLLTIGMVVPALVACAGEPIAVEEAPSTAQARTTPAHEPTGAPSGRPTPTRTGSPRTPTPTAGASSSPENAAYWSFPTTAEGWELTTQDEDGLNQLTKDRSCSYTSSQNLFSPSGNGDRADSEDLAEQWKDSIESQYADAESTTSDSLDIKSYTSGEAIEMVRVESTYTNKGVSIRATTWIRTFTTIDTPTAMLLAYTCETGSYSATEMNQLLDDTTIVNPGPARMDDGRPTDGSSDKT